RSQVSFSIPGAAGTATAHHQYEVTRHRNGHPFLNFHILPVLLSQRVSTRLHMVDSKSDNRISESEKHLSSMCFQSECSERFRLYLRYLLYTCRMIPR